jgi:RES domain-containing protein
LNSLPPPLGRGDLVAWRLDRAIFKDDWDRGIGAARAGGRWNSPNMHAVYCALDPATAIIEVAVHTGFDDLDIVPHVMTSVLFQTPSDIRVVNPEDVPNENWLRPGYPKEDQKKFGDDLLAKHGVFVIPSAVSRYSWTLIFLSGTKSGSYVLNGQDPFALDPRRAS